MQYIYLVSFMFLLLESIQFATIMNLATIKDGFVPVPILMAVGWGTPAVITGKHNDYECHYDLANPIWLYFVVGITASSSFHHYRSYFSCWVNYGHNNSLGTILPTGLIVVATLVLTESTSMRFRRRLPTISKIQWTAARYIDKQ